MESQLSEMHNLKPYMAQIFLNGVYHFEAIHFLTRRNLEINPKHQIRDAKCSRKIFGHYVLWFSKLSFLKFIKSTFGIGKPITKLGGVCQTESSQFVICTYSTGLRCRMNRCCLPPLIILLNCRKDSLLCAISRERWNLVNSPPPPCDN